MSVSALYLMGSFAILLLGLFTGLLAESFPVQRGAGALLAASRLQYVLGGAAIFVGGALLLVRAEPVPAETVHGRLARLSFWLMFIGFNSVFFPAAIRRSPILLTDAAQMFSTTAGIDVLLGGAALLAGVLLFVSSLVLTERPVRM